MFPIRLNLLSPEKKSRLHHMVYVQFAKNSLEILLVVLCLSGIMLLGTQWVLQGYFNDLTSSLNTSSPEEKKNQRIREVNRLLQKVENLQNMYTLWIPMLTEIVSAVPDTIVLTNLHLDAVNVVHTFTGTAKTRDDLLEFKRNLEALSFIENVTIPLSQITAKDNVPFSITAVVKEN